MIVDSTYASALQSMRTLRFRLVKRAGRLSRTNNRQVRRMTSNPATETLYTQVSHALVT